MVTKQIRDEILDKLRDGATGLNAILAAICPAPPYEIEALRFDLADGSSQLFQGFLDVDALEADSGIQYPCLIGPYGTSANNPDLPPRSKGSEFHGAVSMALDFYLAYPTTAHPANFEDETDALEQALVTAFNGRGVYFAPPIAYNGGMAFQRGPLRLVDNGQAWRRLLRVTMIFETRQP